MKSVRWAIIGMGVFAATATFAVAQSGAFGRLVSVFGSDDASVVANQGESRDAASAESFRWAGRLAEGASLEIKGVNGDPGTVRIERVEHEDGVTFCAVYPTPEGKRENECAPGSGGRMSVDRNDVVVDFEIRVPAGTHLVARTVNGGVTALDLGGDVLANTVNGGIEISTTGFAQAETVNGDIDVEMGSPDFAQGAEFSTVNGSITLDVADGVDADVRAQWLNGGFESEIPFTLDGRIGKRSARGVLGDGGPELSLETVNGSIRIR
jgi:hypothetical protein